VSANPPSIEVARGQCLCGEITYQATGLPKWVAHCHCQSCRRNTGSVVATFVGFAVSNVEFVSGSRQFFNSSAGVQRGFCGRCGTPVSYESERYTDEIHLYLCTLDEPDKFPATAHVYSSEQVAWFECHDALPRYQGTMQRGAAVEFGPLNGR